MDLMQSEMPKHTNLKALTPSLSLKKRSVEMKEKDRVEEIKYRKPQKGNVHLGHWVISLVFCLFLSFFFKYTLTV